MQPARSVPPKQSTTTADRPSDERKAPPSNDGVQTTELGCVNELTESFLNAFLLAADESIPSVMLPVLDADFRDALTGCKSVNGVDHT